MEKLSKNFKTTAEYNQMLTRIRHIIDIASGCLPTTGAVQVAPWLYVEIVPTFDYHVSVCDRKSQTGWQLIFVNRCEKNGIFRFHGFRDCVYSKRARKKDGKAKAAEKFTDAIFLYTFKNGCIIGSLI